MKEIESVVDYIRSDFMMLGSEKSKEVTSSQSHTIAAPTSAATVLVDMAVPFPHNLIGDADKGEQFYNNNCYVCHGKQGNGKGPRAHFNTPRPRDFTSDVSRQELNRPRLFRAISKGKARTVMPAWSTVLSNQEIANVAEYVFQSFVLKQKKKP